MATNRRNAKKRSLTPGKLILIGVLAVILVVVIILQLGGDTPTANVETNNRPPAATAPRQVHRPRQAPPKPTRSDLVVSPTKPWPLKAIEDVVAHDPFALPLALLPAEVVKGNAAASTQDDQVDQQLRMASLRRQLEEQREIEEKIAAFQEQGVAMMFFGAGEPLAKIGTKTYRVGDIVDDLKIVEIHTDGTIVVEYHPDD